MTKIKNTKKGMAKKTLSMSLVVAMLATSNVPVWATEFSDGTDAAEVTTETPAVETEAFSDNEAETPVVEDTENTASAQKAQGSYYFEGFKQATCVDWKGTAFNADGKSVDADGNIIKLVEGSVKRSDNGASAGDLSYVWRVDGAWVGSGQTFNADDLTSISLSNNIKDKKYVGKKLELCFIEKNDNDGEPVLTVDFGTIKAVDITGATVSFKNPSFTGKEQKISPDSIYSSIIGGTLSEEDFDWNYSGTNGIIKAGSVVTATGTAKASNKSGITGTVTGTFTIQPITTIAAEDIKISLNDANKTYTYTGSNVEVPVSDVKITYKDTNFDLSSYVQSITTSKDVNGTGYDTVTVKFDDKKLNADGFPARGNIQVTLAGTAKVKVAKLNLASPSCTVKALRSYTNASQNTLTYGTDYVIVKDGKELALEPNDVKLTLASKVDDYKNPQVYDKAIVITGIGANVEGTAYGSMTITTGTFENAVFKEATIDLVKNTNDQITKTMDYTGKAPTYGVTVAGVQTVLGGLYGSKTDATPLSSTSYDVTFENIDKVSTDKQLAKVTITGKNEFQGCTKTFYFKIVPATVKADSAKDAAVNSITVKSTDGIEQNDSYTNASDYKNAIGLAIAASAKDPVAPTNPKKNISLPLTEGTDYTVTSYKFTEDTTGKEWTSKSTSKYVEVKANITTDKVAVEAGTANYGNGAVVATLTKAVAATSTEAAKPATLTLYVKVNNKSLSNANVTLDKSVYTYTGKEIIPEVTVTYGGKTLVKDKDYTIVTSNAKDAGDAAKVTVIGKGEFGGSIEKSFTIEKANVANLTVTLKKSATQTYDGTQKRPGLADMDIKLGDNTLNLTSDKELTVAYGANVNAGENAGTLTITATDKNKNFTGSINVSFDIKAKALEVNDLPISVYNEYGKDLTTDLKKGNAELTWTGSAVTFAKTNVDLTKIVNKPTAAPDLTNSDVEAVYVNNIDSTDTGSYAYIVLVGKGNYTGDYSIVKDKNDSVIYMPTLQVEAVNKKNPGTYQILQSGVIEGSVARFTISGSTFTTKDVTVNDGVYAGGLSVAPTVTVVRNGKALVQGTDYKVEIVNANDDTVNVTGKAIEVVVVGLGQYKGTWISNDINGKNLTYKVVKKDLKDCSVSVDKDGKLTVMNGNVVEENEKFDVKDNGDGTVTVSVVNGGKNYTGSVTIDKGFTKVGAPIISNVKVVGNKATVILSGDVEGASGYDYVISTDKDCITNKQYDAVDKNKAKTTISFKYVNQGTYYAYCHAWTRDENGKKVFGEWSNAYPFSVEAVTPDAPVITNVKVSGSTIKVTYNAAANAAGYDVVLGTSSKKDNGELRPYNYGSHKVLNIKEGTVTATFKNVPAGTWTVGMHAFSRDPETNKKVFSPWSNLKKATVK